MLPKEFVVYTDNHALSFLNRQEKLNHRHMKWIEFLQAYTFTIKHKKGETNKVADALRRRNLTIREVQLESIGIHAIKDMYEQDEDFKEAYQFSNPWAKGTILNLMSIFYKKVFCLRGVNFVFPRDQLGRTS